MIRQFFASVLMLILAVGCGYGWWEVSQLNGQVTQLKADVAHYKKLAEERSTGHRRHGQQAAPSSADDESEDSAAAEGWLALANQHIDKAKAAFDAHNYGIAQSEFQAAASDVQKGTAEPVKATQSTLAMVQQKIAQLEGGINGLTGSSKASGNQ
jgi:predicted negative regulator of RcsB-dependent stress response